MKMPTISKEIIESIYNQSIRGKEDEQCGIPSYNIDIVKQMHAENPELFTAVQQTIISVVDKFDLNIEDNKDMNITANMVLLSACVYHAIKQQLICDELANE